MIKNILEYLEASAGRYPDKTAFADQERSCTFEELLKRAHRIGSGLAGRIPPRRPVPVLMEKGVDTIAVFMGIVCAGCFYTLVDIRQPETRIRQILAALETETVISSRAYAVQLEKMGFSGQVLWLEELDAVPADEALLKEIRSGARDTDPLYGIFTSGSTGVPKGVVVCHRSVIDFIDHFTELFGITRQDVIGNQAPWDFDVSVKDIYSGLKTGAEVQIIPKKLFSFPVELLDFLCEHRVTTLIWAVSALCIITTLHGFDYRIPDSVKRVLFSGEVMPQKHLRQWMQALPRAEFVNLYGPTEITCNCTYYRVKRTPGDGDPLPIGRPFPNETVFLLDEEDHEITVPGKKGEICVAGTALALGYYNNPEQTRKVFVQNPLNSRYPEKIYRTGDLGYYGEDRELYFASRKDFQIKHMGNRIELGEIEAAMGRIAGIGRCCCIFDGEKNRMEAFYEGDLEKRQIKKILGMQLPAFMIPNGFHRVDCFPLTKNGKTDREELKRMVKEGIL